MQVKASPARRRSCRALRGQQSSRGVSTKGPLMDGLQLRTSLSTPPPREEDGADNFSPSRTPLQMAAAAAPPPPAVQTAAPHRLHVPKAMHIGKRHSEPIPVLLEHSRRRLRDQDSGTAHGSSSSRLRSPSAAMPPVRTMMLAMQTAAPAPATRSMPRPPPLQLPVRHRPTDAFLYRDIQHSPSSRFTAASNDSDTSSEDDEDVGKAVARVVRQQLVGLPALADALVRLMMHDGICSSQELVKVAAGGRGSNALDAVAAAAVSRVLVSADEAQG